MILKENQGLVNKEQEFSAEFARSLRRLTKSVKTHYKKFTPSERKLFIAHLKTMIMFLED